ncbi:hypothetical protein THIOM_004993 [Candidatus Thiomargarita nelsonii]|uniref:Uncharacterized protein n=1 Tax=Candidatus Thiomargarita nelsonii TaxID=1003181 RepID=A0A176RUG6_9GAMM|nr:hypothetical protein THIOM_004993 [Candidatus Thiomargarita nelsonii]
MGWGIYVLKMVNNKFYDVFIKTYRIFLNKNNQKLKKSGICFCILLIYKYYLIDSKLFIIIIVCTNPLILNLIDKNSLF